MFRVIVLLFSFLFSTSIWAEIRTLETFYPQLDQAAAILKSQADLDAQRAHLRANEAQKGWEFFANVSGGYQKSPFAREPFGRFFDPLARLGLRYPLLGSAEKQQREINDAATLVQIEDLRLEWSQRLAVLFMEENYAAYWSAQRLLVLNQAYLNLRENGVEQRLLERQQAGLLLASDYYEFTSAFEQAERAKIEFNSNMQLALTRLAQLSNETVYPFQAVKPELTAIVDTATVDIEQLDLGILQAKIENLQTMRETENWHGIDSDFSAIVFGGPAIPYPSSDSAQYGYGGAVGLSVRMPLEIIRYRKKIKSRINSQLNSLLAEHRHRGQELDLEFSTLLGQYQRFSQQINFQMARLNAAKESVRERYLRLQALDGDVFEQYLQAINLYYRAAVEYIETETELWKLHIRLRQFITIATAPGKFDHLELDDDVMIKPIEEAGLYLQHGSDENKTVELNVPEESDPVAAPKPSIPKPSRKTSRPISFAVYLWNYEALRKAPNFWQQADLLGIQRILLSFTQPEIQVISDDASELKTIVQTAHHHGIQVELLLGDPDWILAENRDNLLQIIQSLRHINFDGLHLDIEPEQLVSELKGKGRLEAFVESIRQAISASPWPVGISIHPRHLEEKTSYGICIPCEVERAGGKEIAVMYYSMHIEKIVQTMQSAMHRFSSLTFSLAQSLERELGPENSYASKPSGIFRQAMLTLNEQLQTINFGGLIIQSWQEWEHYENPL